MHFCTNCHNMYYLKISDNEGEENSLIYYCRNCGNEDKSIIADNLCVSETQLRRSEQKFTFMVNEYTKYDPTLPRINMIKCPNQECSSNAAAGGGGSKKKQATAQAQAPAAQATAQAQAPEQATAAPATAAQAQAQEQAIEQREVIYIRYDDINMKYIYLCVHCDTIWKTDNRI